MARTFVTWRSSLSARTMQSSLTKGVRKLALHPKKAVVQLGSSGSKIRGYGTSYEPSNEIVFLGLRNDVLTQLTNI